MKLLELQVLRAGGIGFGGTGGELLEPRVPKGFGNVPDRVQCSRQVSLLALFPNAVGENTWAYFGGVSTV